MRTLYAIALICLSVPAFATEDFGDLPYDAEMETGYFYDAGPDIFGDDKTATIMPSDTPTSEDELVPASEAGYLYDTGADFDFGDENTGTIILSAMPQREDHRFELGSFTPEDWTYQGDVVVLAFPAADWF